MDYYAVLELDRGCTKKNIKKSFHKLAHIHHPDKGGDIEVFKKINQAYQYLMKNHTEYQKVNVTGGDGWIFYTWGNGTY